ncbi:hypothetical protein HHK36_032768 [Tetracentron sinense]|uniref:Dynamin GTPase effector domain-containing protein n=1 Tax=Tetracentron sinense TaxID=13715 RepID=A0A834Y4Z3_TETSI|nr:hypothetical protein HHK36_032768 [Tetracentron sinense]
MESAHDSRGSLHEGLEALGFPRCNPRVFGYSSDWTSEKAHGDGLHLLYSVKNLVNKERMLEESPSVASKRQRLNQSIKESAHDSRGSLHEGLEALGFPRCNPRVFGYSSDWTSEKAHGDGLHLLYSVKNLVNKGIDRELANEFMGPHGGGLERMLEESPSVASKRQRLNQSIKVLRESKDVVANITDRIAAYAN